MTESFKSNLVYNLYKANNFNKTRTARDLKISLRTLYRILDQQKQKEFIEIGLSVDPLAYPVVKNNFLKVIKSQKADYINYALIKNNRDIGKVSKELNISKTMIYSVMGS